MRQGNSGVGGSKFGRCGPAGFSLSLVPTGPTVKAKGNRREPWCFDHSGFRAPTRAHGGRSEISQQRTMSRAPCARFGAWDSWGGIFQGAGRVPGTLRSRRSHRWRLDARPVPAGFGHAAGVVGVPLATTFTERRYRRFIGGIPSRCVPWTAGFPGGRQSRLWESLNRRNSAGRQVGFRGVSRVPVRLPAGTDSIHATLTPKQQSRYSGVVAAPVG
jgi:hypothetical protein